MPRRLLTLLGLCVLLGSCAGVTPSTTLLSQDYEAFAVGTFPEQPGPVGLTEYKLDLPAGYTTADTRLGEVIMHTGGSLGLQFSSLTPTLVQYNTFFSDNFVQASAQVRVYPKLFEDVGDTPTFELSIGGADSAFNRLGVRFSRGEILAQPLTGGFEKIGTYGRNTRSMIVTLHVNLETQRAEVLLIPESNESIERFSRSVDPVNFRQNVFDGSLSLNMLLGPARIRSASQRVIVDDIQIWYQ